MRIILWIFYGYLFSWLLKFLLKLLGRTLFQVSAPQRKKSQVSNGEMVHDLMCDTYILKAGAISKSDKGTVYYFCSEECSKKFLRKKQ